MKRSSNSLLFVLWTVGLLAAGCGGGAPSVDLADRSLGVLSWGTFNFGFVDKNLDKALVYANEAEKLYAGEAREMQASLSEFPSTDPPEETFKYKALNHVASIMVAKGILLEEKGDVEGAKAAFQTVIDDYGYAQVQDNGPWESLIGATSTDAEGFFRVADVAKQKLDALGTGN